MADPDDDPYLYGYLKEQLAAADRAAGGIHAGGVERGLSAVSDQG